MGAINNADSYQWVIPAGGTILSGAGSDSINVVYTSNSSAGNVTVMGKNACGNGIASQILPVSIIDIPTLAICYVTVDTTSKYNQIVWAKPSSSEIKSFNVYKETVNGFEIINTVPYGSSTMITDSSSSPDVVSSSYRISAVDTCDNENSLSNIHSTIHLSANLGASDEVNLHWTKYEGLVVKYYRILRDDNGNGIFHVLDSVPQSIVDYTDLNAASFPLCRYAIEVAWSGECGPSNKTLASVNTTRSNIKNNNKMVTLVPSDAVRNGFSIYPNPSSGMLAVEFIAEGASTIVVYNTVGQLVFSKTIHYSGKTIEQIDLSAFSKGIYSLKIATGSASQIKKVVIE